MPAAIPEKPVADEVLLSMMQSVRVTVAPTCVALTPAPKALLMVVLIALLLILVPVTLMTDAGVVVRPVMSRPAPVVPELGTELPAKLLLIDPPVIVRFAPDVPTETPPPRPSERLFVTNTL